MVQMGDSVAVERCVQNLNNVSVGITGAAPVTHHNHNNSNENRDQIGEHKLQLAFSKQPYLSEVTNPYPLPDKSPSYKEYITNKNNRFISPAMASKNRIQPPSKVSSTNTLTCWTTLCSFKYNGLLAYILSGYLKYTRWMDTVKYYKN